MSMRREDVKIEDIIKIVIQAGGIAMNFYDKEYAIEQKQDKTLVTDADIAINDYLMKKLSIYNYPILSEEVKDNFDERKNANLTWIIDPLDGTSDFIQKTGEFSIMIGLANREGESVLGVVCAPALNELYYAQKNKGAFFLNDLHGCKTLPQQIYVNKKKMQDSKILVSRNHLGDYEQEIAERYNMIQISVGSAGLKICKIAKGDAELYINSSDKSGLWDICAADIILREACGNICDGIGMKIKYNKKNIMLSNGYNISNIPINLNNE